MHTPASIVALGLVGITLSCTQTPPPSPTPAPTGGPAVSAADSVEVPEYLQGASLDVDNRGFVDCDIYVLHDGVRERVGSVIAIKQASFQLRSAQLGNSGQIQLIAHQIGTNGDYTSEIFLVRGGQAIEWMLADDINRSFVAVY